MKRPHGLRPIPTVLCALGLFAATVAAHGREPQQIYQGMTKDQLAQFAAGRGWQAEGSQLGLSVTLRVGEQTAHVIMMDCTDDGVCRSGLIRNISYHSIGSLGGVCDLWHWNLEARGATGFGPDYVTLQRYLNFRGVTDQYLEDVLNAWLKASTSFWEVLEECASKGQ